MSMKYLVRNCKQSCTLIGVAAIVLFLSKNTTSQTGKLIGELTGHKKEIISIKFSPDNKTLLSGDEDNTIILWDTQAGLLNKQLEADKKARLFSVHFCADGQLVASQSYHELEESIELWDSQTGSLKRTLKNNGLSRFSADGKTIVSWSDMTLKLIDTQTGESKHTMTGHDHIVGSVFFSPDSNIIATTSAKLIFTKVSLSSGPFTVVSKEMSLVGNNASSSVMKFRRSLSKPTNVIEARGVDAETGELMVISRMAPWSLPPDFTSIQDDVRLWDIQIGKLKIVLKWPRESGEEINRAIFSPDGSTLAVYTSFVASGNVSSKIILFDMNTGENRQTLTWTSTVGKSEIPTFFAFASNSKTLASWEASDKILRFWDVQTGDLKKMVTEIINVFSISPDDRILALGRDQKLAFWNAQTGDSSLTLPILRNSIDFFMLSPSGKILATSKDKKDKKIELWDTQTGQFKLTLSGYKGSVTKLLFSADDKLLASAGKDKTIMLWDLSN